MRFVVGVLHVVKSLHDTGVFVETAFGTNVRAYGVLDLGGALQGDGVVVDPLFAVELENALGRACPKFALVEKSVFGTGCHVRKERGLLCICLVGTAPFVGERSECKPCRVVIHGGCVIGKCGSDFAHT